MTEIKRRLVEKIIDPTYLDGLKNKDIDVAPLISLRYRDIVEIDRCVDFQAARRHLFETRPAVLVTSIASAGTADREERTSPTRPWKQRAIPTQVIPAIT